MRIVAGLMSLLFFWASMLQWNDPDPVLWVVGYLVASGLSAAAAAGLGLRIPNTVAGVVFGLWFLSLAPTLLDADPAAFRSFEMQAPSHEEPREAIGLLLCAGWSGVLAWRARMKVGSSPTG